MLKKLKWVILAVWYNAYMVTNSATVHVINYNITLLDILLDGNNHPHRLCLVTYYLPENFQPTVLPHGNNKQNKPYYPTLPSTMSAIKEKFQLIVKCFKVA